MGSHPKIWDVTSGKTTMNLKGHALPSVQTESDVGFWRFTSVAFSPDGKRLVSGGGDDDLKIWDIKTGEALFTLSHDNEYDVTAQ